MSDPFNINDRKDPVQVSFDIDYSYIKCSFFLAKDDE